MQRDVMKSAFFIIISAGLLVLLYPLMHEKSSFLSSRFRTYHFLDRYLPIKSLPAPDSILADTIPFLLETEPEEVKYSGIHFLADFFEDLSQNNSQIRIAYYGDSAIEGDLISQTVRDSLQRQFGGDGVGFMPLVSHINGFRRSINLHFSDDWAMIKMNRSAPEGIYFGYLGSAFTCKSNFEEEDSAESEVSDFKHIDSTNVDKEGPVILDAPLGLPAKKTAPEGIYSARFSASKRFPGTSIFTTSRLFYSPPLDVESPHGKVKVKVREDIKEIDLSGTEMVNDVNLYPGACRRIELDFDSICNQLIFGVSFESKRGVILDNLPLRGNSGVWLNRIKTSTLLGFQKSLDVDLVILQFGLNVLNSEMTDYHWYETEMKQVINHVKKGFPGASILVIGPADKAVRLNEKMQTDPSVLLITDVLRTVAEENEVAFFSFFEAMGGQGSMVKWVEESSPKLANSDYTHFNFEGAEKAGGFLLDFLLGAFENYLTAQQRSEN